MPYRILVPGAVGDQNFEAGDILDLPEEYATGWVEQGLAVPTTDPPTVTMSAADLPLTFPQPQQLEPDAGAAPVEAPAPPPPPPPPPPPAPEPAPEPAKPSKST